MAEDALVFLVDVDNTLLDNDALVADLMAYLDQAFGAKARMQYHALLESLRDELGYVDYLGAFQRYRLSVPDDPHVLLAASFLLDYPFANRLYHGALDVIEALRRHGPVVIHSDGDVVFQPRKVQRSGLWRTVEGKVLIYVHKETMLATTAALYPARHYVVIDDKLTILRSIKEAWRERVTTVFVRQGHYAKAARSAHQTDGADVTVERIDDLLSDRFAWGEQAA